MSSKRNANLFGRTMNTKKLRNNNRKPRASSVFKRMTTQDLLTLAQAALAE